MLSPLLKVVKGEQMKTAEVKQATTSPKKKQTIDVEDSQSQDLFLKRDFNHVSVTVGSSVRFSFTENKKKC